MPVTPTVPRASGGIPLLGFGTFGLNGDVGRRAVEMALECGYRHVDTAEGYGNHEAVGAALNAGIVPRDEVFVTTKVSPDHLRFDSLLDAAQRALRDLRIGYIDLYLVHWPNPDVPIDETLRAMRKLLDEGIIRNCGVSNFTAKRLAEAVGTGIAPVAVNQVEYHPHLNQRKLLAACRELGVALTAYSPLAQGRLASDERLAEVGRRHGRSAAQVALRWLYQHGIPAIPKASSRERILANLAVLDWELPQDDMATVDGLGHWERVIAWELSGPDDQAINR